MRVLMMIFRTQIHVKLGPNGGPIIVKK